MQLKQIKSRRDKNRILMFTAIYELSSGNSYTCKITHEDVELRIKEIFQEVLPKFLELTCLEGKSIEEQAEIISIDFKETHNASTDEYYYFIVPKLEVQSRVFAKQDEETGEDLYKMFKISLPNIPEHTVPDLAMRKLKELSSQLEAYAKDAYNRDNSQLSLSDLTDRVLSGELRHIEIDDDGVVKTNTLTALEKFK